MKRPAHPSVEWNRAQRQRAVSYAATVWFNGRHNRVTTDTEDAAHEWARRLETAADNGRRALVYAITPEGWTIPVDRKENE